MKLFRVGGYLLVFIFSFLFFLYLMFPYDDLRDRVMMEIERQLGGNVEVSVDSLKPYRLSGVKISNLSIAYRDEGKKTPLLKLTEARARASLFSVLLGNPTLSFELKAGGGSVVGAGQQSGGELLLDMDFEDLDLSSLQFLASRYGLNITSRIDGSVKVALNQQNAMRSSGKFDLTFRALTLGESEIVFGEGAIPIPELVIARGRGARLKATLERGVVDLEVFNLSGGDLGLDLQGKIFLSGDVQNYRLNLTGSFTDSPKLSQTLPFLFIVEKQKQPDGTYPLSMTGRLSRPSIKVGTFTIPL